MLNQIRYTVKFKTPARTLTGNFTFDKGLTAITGPNGHGKSFVLEMIQFLLHGTEALRGKMDNYELIDGTLDFEIKGRQLRVERTKSKAVLRELIVDTVVDLASGTKPVNNKILELFGYSSEVFRVANVCNQGKIEELGEMKPSERKQLVDETIGLNVLDDITAMIDEERKRLSGGIKAVEGILVAPVEPEDPKLEYDANHYKECRNQYQIQREKRTLLRAAVAKTLVAPVEPEAIPDNDKLEEYTTSQERRHAILTEVLVLDKQLKAIPPKPDSLVDKLEDDDADLEKHQRTIMEGEKLKMAISVNKKGLEKYKWTEPVLSLEEIAAYEARNVLVARWEEKMRLKSKNVPHDCPKCQHHWEDEDPRVKAEFGDVPDEKPEVLMATPLLNKAIANRNNHEMAKPIQKHIEELEAQLKDHDQAAAAKAIKRIGDTRDAFNKSQVALKNEERGKELAEKLLALAEELKNFPDMKDRIKAIVEYRAELSKYTVKNEEYTKQVTEQKVAELELLEFSETLDAEITQMEANYVLAMNYENNLGHYQRAKEAYDKALGNLNNLKAELEDWTNGRAAVVDLRAKVKGYLLPSLNSVASILINQMTGGELSWITVNDQFEITVEGQPLETLSGAGKAVANLALRIGLGQVLTNRVFSVMMLDEIDASCDEARAKYIAECLKNLTKTIGQVIQVSHKSGLPADHYVRL
jgi:DNA repair exonuclease SbcCD ATPase subunit